MAELLSLCRLCVNPRTTGEDLFSTKSDELSYAEFLQDVFKIEIPNDALLPHMACTTCIDQVVQIQNLKIQFQSAQEQFQELLINLENEQSKDNLDIVVVTEEIIEMDEHFPEEEVEDESSFIIEEEIVEKEAEEASQETVETEETVETVEEDFNSWEEEKQALEVEMSKMNLLTCHLCQNPCTSLADLETHFQEKHKKKSAYIFCCNEKFGMHTAHYHIRSHMKSRRKQKKRRQREADGEAVAHDEDADDHNDQEGDSENVEVEDGQQSIKDAAKFYCDICGKAYKTRNSLNGHRRQHLADPENNRCDECGRIFKNRYNLKLHKRTHIAPEHRQRPFTCQYCGKGFEEERHIKQHMFTHEQSVSTQCQVCGKHVFRLAQHMRRSHSGKPKEICTICGFATTRLSSHMREVHEPQTPQTCEICGKEFASRSRLLRHHQIHLGVREPCPYCAFESSKGNLLIHIKGLHPEKVDEFRRQKTMTPKFRE